MFMFMSSWVPTQIGWPVKETMPIDIIFINVSTTITVTSDRPIGFILCSLESIESPGTFRCCVFFQCGWTTSDHTPQAEQQKARYGTEQLRRIGEATRDRERSSRRLLADGRP